MREIHWAVLGTGVIANEMATALEKNGKKLYAVGNRTYEKAVKFGEKYGIKKVYTDFNEMFTDPEVDVIYITTPHNTHIQFMKKAIENGKHILVEKSITLNSKELDEALELAKEKGVIVAEAMTIFHMPVYKELKKILESGKLGKVNLITMNFGSFKEYDMNNLEPEPGWGYHAGYRRVCSFFYPVVYGLQAGSVIVPDEGGAYRGR